MKILAFYLPQFHRIRENDKWWGDGYTEWSAVKNAKLLFKEHNQPRIPFNNNYYDLNDENATTWLWQTNLANKYGIYGFCIYHYWFKGKQLLEKPMEILLRHPEIKIKYTICWANESWARNWYGLEKETLVKQEYGNEEDWKKHFEYLLKFFKDPRYIKIDNKPMIHIYHTIDIYEIENMTKVWSDMAIENGFAGVYIVSGNTGYTLENRYQVVDAFYNFEPGYTLNHRIDLINKLKYLTIGGIRMLLNNIIKTNLIERIIDIRLIYNKNTQLNLIKGKQVFLGTFPGWDNTPRRGIKGLFYKNSSPKMFEENLMHIKEKLKNEDENKMFVYINAWNEWGEGAYLEPDSVYKFSFLNCIKKTLDK